MQSFVADVDVCSNSLMVYAMLMERKMDLLFLKSYATIAEKKGNSIKNEVRFLPGY